VFFEFDEFGFAQHTEVLGDVVLREVQGLGDFIHAALLLHEHADDAQAAFLAERLHGRDAVEFFHRCRLIECEVAINRGSAAFCGRSAAAFGIDRLVVAMGGDGFAGSEVFFVVE
jgi:hypothetical protein